MPMYQLGLVQIRASILELILGLLFGGERPKYLRNVYSFLGNALAENWSWDWIWTQIPTLSCG